MSNPSISLSVWHSGFAYPPAELASLVEPLYTALLNDQDSRIAVHLPESPLFAAAVALLSSLRRGIGVFGAELSNEEAEQTAEEIGCSYIARASNNEGTTRLVLQRLGKGRNQPAPIDPAVFLFTSGSTGKPKIVEHTWESLRTSVRVHSCFRKARWLGLYPLDRFAGFNTLLHAILNSSTLIIPESLRPDSLIDALERSSPTHISGTPTMWKVLLMRMHEGGWMDYVERITLGGETVDQSILSALRLRFPNARITHIYASTEAGVCLVVSDGLAGFPMSWLEDPSRDVQLRVRDGALWVRRSGGQSRTLRDTSSQEGWWRTGDEVIVRGERVYFLGRQTELLNVGGAKVAPVLVEGKLREVDGVLEARVTGRKSALSGIVLVAEVVCSSSISQFELRRELIAHCRRSLPAFAVPRIVQFVEAIPVSGSGKMVRE